MHVPALARPNLSLCTTTAAPVMYDIMHIHTHDNSSGQAIHAHAIAQFKELLMSPRTMLERRIDITDAFGM